MRINSAKDLDVYNISDKEHAELTAISTSVGKMLGSMMRNPGPFLISAARPSSDLRSPPSALRPPISDV